MRAHFMCANYEEDNLGLRSDDLNKCSELTSSENDCPFLFFDILFYFILFYFILFYFILFISVFLPFLGPFPWHMEVPRLGV